MHRLSVEHDLDLPWDEQESSSGRQSCRERDIVDVIAFLYFQYAHALSTAIDEFRNWLPKFPTSEKKLSYLFDRLKIARTSCLKRRSSRGLAHSRSRCSPRSSDLSLPTSPTLGVKHAPKSNVEMSAEDLRSPDAGTLRKASLKRPRSNQSLADKMRATRSNAHLAGPNADLARPRATPSDPFAIATGAMPPPSCTPLSTQQPGLTSASASFTSHGLTSANTSFCSNAHLGTQEAQSPATPIGDSFHDADGKDSFGFDGARASPTQYDSSQDWEGVSLSQLGGTQLQPPVTSDKTSPSDNFAARKDEQLPSPPKTNHREGIYELTGRQRVEQIINEGLSSFVTPPWLLSLPPDLRLDAIRVMQMACMSMTELERLWAHPRNMESLQKLAVDSRIPYKPGRKQGLSEDGIVAKMSWSGKAQGRVFDCKLCPPRRDKSNAFERKYGKSRFMTVDLEPSNKPPKDMDLEKHGLVIPQYVQELFRKEQHFAGLVWQQFLVQPKKSRGSNKGFVKGTLQFTLFAVRSEPDAATPLDEIRISEVLDWAVQFSQNASAPHRKVYSRLDLSASRTSSTIQFSPDEIMCDVPDDMPTDDSDDLQFHDHLFQPNNNRSKEAMNDGCSRISTWAMREIQRAMDLDYLPSVAQGRIFGAKGLWFRDDADANLDHKPA